jgi:hypothetical protein
MSWIAARPPRVADLRMPPAISPAPRDSLRAVLVVGGCVRVGGQAEDPRRFGLLWKDLWGAAQPAAGDEWVGD